jgi:hypothetical protein
MSMPDLPEGWKWSVQEDYYHGDQVVKLQLFDGDDPVESLFVNTGGIRSEAELVETVEHSAHRMWKKILGQIAVGGWIRSNWGG